MVFIAPDRLIDGKPARYQLTDGRPLTGSSDPPTVGFATIPGSLEAWIGDFFSADVRVLLFGQVKGANDPPLPVAPAHPAGLPLRSEDTCIN